MSGRHPLRLYKSILRLVPNYPSSNASKLLTSIKEEFRLNRSLKGAPLQKAIKEAEEGVTHLRQYVFEDKEPNWEVTSSQTPMPQRSKGD